MTPGFKGWAAKIGLGAVWLFILVWPMTGINPEGLTFAKTFKIMGLAGLVAGFYFGLKYLKPALAQTRAADFLSQTATRTARIFTRAPGWSLKAAGLAGLCLYPGLASRYGQDVAINVLVYVTLGLGLNVVVGLAGLLDLGYIAFYGVGAYGYALLSIHYQLSFWLALPVCAGLTALAGCVIGYPTLRMRGDYLAIVTLGFGEILRIVLNNWMDLTGGPNGLLGIKPAAIYWPDPENHFALVLTPIKSLTAQYYLILAIALFTMLAVRRLADSRIGRGWEAIREDETAANLMGVNSFALKLLAYAMGAVFAGLAGAFFAAKMRFVSPGSFTFIESAMVLSMVVLGGMGSIPGIILGALVLIGLPEAFREFEFYRMLVFGMAMTLMMLFRPAGLIPAKRVARRSEEAH
jgi:branched-chain amino acid transport system permease protein